MKKVAYLLAALTFVLFVTTSALAYDFVLNDGAATYQCTYLNTYQGQLIYTVDVVNPYPGKGFLFFSTDYSCFTVKVFHTSSWYSYSQEGYWTGSGSTYYNANCGGGLYSGTMSVGPASAGAGDGSGNSNLIE